MKKILDDFFKRDDFNREEFLRLWNRPGRSESELAYYVFLYFNRLSDIKTSLEACIYSEYAPEDSVEGVHYITKYDGNILNFHRIFASEDRDYPYGLNLVSIYDKAMISENLISKIYDEDFLGRKTSIKNFIDLLELTTESYARQI